MLAGVLLLAAPLAAFGQNNAVRQRVIDRVDVTRLATLSGNTHPRARAQYDQGAAPADLPMNRMMLVLKRSPEQESALQDLLTQQQITASANFRKWLTPDQFGQQFGLADADIQAVTSWLTSFGFQSIKVSKGRNIIEFSGTAAQVETALHTSIHNYFVNGENHWANTSDPQIPAALAPVISGIVSLHDFHPKPTIVRSDRKLTASVTPGPRPQINLTNSNNQTIHALVPADFNTIYNIANTMTGSNVTIAIIANANINVQDVADFRSAWGLSAKNPTIILNGPDPGVTPGSAGEGEAVLDATWSGAVAPAAAVDLVVSEDTNASSGADLSEFYIIDNNLADVMTESFSSCESQFIPMLTGSNGAASFYSGMAEQAAAQGITDVVASGDGGPDSCDDPSTEPATTAASVNILASTPFTVAVGGTQFNDLASPSTYWKTSNDQATSESAKSYIPENVWNESCTVAQVGQAGCPASGLWSSGGGQSIAFPKPIWQTGPEIPSNIASTNARFVPDVAMTAADHDGYVICIDGSCQMNPQAFGIASGTSASAQVFGGVMALVVQKMGGRVGNANYPLYNLAAKETYANCNGSTVPSPATLSTCVFNDVTVGNTNVPGETGLTAGVGYDETTGLGSVNVSNLVNSWHTAIVNGTTTTLKLNNGSPVNVPHGTPVPVDITVSAVAGTPTGDVSLISDNSATDKGIDGFTLSSSGTVSGAVNSTILLPGGTYQVHAHYAGDKTFLGSDSTPGITVTVTPQSSQINFGIVIIDTITGACSTTTSVAYGSSYILTVDVADALAATTPCAPSVTGSSPSGTVHVSDNGGNLDGGTGNFKLNSFGNFEDQTIQLPAGSHSIQANYLGDNSFKASASATGVITVTQAATTTAVVASQTTVPTNTPVTLTATVSTQSNAIANASQEPTGSVQFLLNGSNLGSAVAVTGGVDSNTSFAQATASISPTLANGQDVITARYLGDSNYAASVASPSVTVAVGISGINVAPGCNSATVTIASPGQSGSCLITVTGANGFAGTVTLTAAVTAEPAGAVDLPTCSFGAPDQNFTPPNTITLSASSETGNATMTCGSMAASGALFRPSSRRHGPNWLLIAEIGAALACMFLLTITSRKRRSMVTLAAVLFMVLAAVTGCGTSNNNGGGNPGTTLGAYTVTVTATPSTGTAQTSAITVNVK